MNTAPRLSPRSRVVGYEDGERNNSHKKSKKKKQSDKRPVGNGGRGISW